MKNPKFQIFKSTANDQYYFRLKARNGEIILGSEGYTTKQNCQNGIASVKAHAHRDSNYQRKDGLGNFTFNLMANNDEIIGRSENYTTRNAREKGIEAVKHNSPNAPIEDLS